MNSVRVLRSGELTTRELVSMRALFDAAWPDPDHGFSADDFDHCLGGIHFVIDDEGEIVTHASVVRRELLAGDHRLITGYVEGVATLPHHEGAGFGTAVMTLAGAHIDDTYQLGALGTGAHHFYERLGWVVWPGPTSVSRDQKVVPTPDDDGFVLIKRTPITPALDLSAPLICEWRSGDVW